MAGTGRRIPALIAPTARDAGLVGCRHCTRVWPRGTPTCTRCGAQLRSRDVTSLQRVWAWMAAGLLFYIPANLYPMLITRTVSVAQEQTIVGGAIELAEYGAVGVAAIVLFASVVIPVGKFVAIAWLAWIVQHPRGHDPKRLLHLYEVVEWIGRWSMIDVFVVAILVALVQFDLLASINPGLAAVCFALSVIFTMLSAMSFDSRAIWDDVELLEREGRAP